MFKLVSYVKRGEIRNEILKRLDKPKTPTQLTKEIKTHQSTVSRAINALVEKKLIACLTPEEKHFKYYQITDIGKEILKKIQELE